jgi:type IV pilus assembly protein PilA
VIERLRRRAGRAGGETGFTLIELLVVMLILGILAAIAIAAFLNQRSKATDTQAKSNVRTLQTAMEACGIDHNGNFSPSCGITELRASEGSIPQSGTSVEANPGTPAGGYTIAATSSNNNRFELVRQKNGNVSRTCTVGSGSNSGGCSGGTW